MLVYYFVHVVEVPLRIYARSPLFPRTMYCFVHHGKNLLRIYNTNRNFSCCRGIFDCSCTVLYTSLRFLFVFTHVLRYFREAMYCFIHGGPPLFLLSTFSEFFVAKYLKKDRQNAQFSACLFRLQLTTFLIIYRFCC